jgi:hypothetical protein
VANVFSTRFFAVHDQPAILPVSYTVPAGFTAVVRDIDVYCADILGGEEFFARGNAGEVFWQDSIALGETGWRMWRGRQVLFEGESWELFGTKVFDLAASGYLLTNP